MGIETGEVKSVKREDDNPNHDKIKETKSEITRGITERGKVTDNNCDFPSFSDASCDF